MSLPDSPASQVVGIGSAALRASRFVSTTVAIKAGSPVACLISRASPRPGRVGGRRSTVGGRRAAGTVTASSSRNDCTSLVARGVVHHVVEGFDHEGLNSRVEIALDDAITWLETISRASS